MFITSEHDRNHDISSSREIILLAETLPHRNAGGKATEKTRTQAFWRATKSQVSCDQTAKPNLLHLLPKAADFSLDLETVSQWVAIIDKNRVMADYPRPATDARQDAVK